MDVITYTDARASLKDVMDRAIHDRAPVVITRRRGEAAVLISLEDYNSIQETLYLLRSPANAEHLRASIAELRAGRGVERELIPPRPTGEA